MTPAIPPDAAVAVKGARERHRHVRTRPPGDRWGRVPLRAAIDLPPAALRVLVALAGHADRDGWTFVSPSAVGDLIGVKRQAVVRQIAALERTGYVVTKRRQYASGAERTAMRRVILRPDSGVQPDIAPVQREGVGGETSSTDRPEPVTLQPGETSGGCTVNSTSSEHTTRPPGRDGQSWDDQCSDALRDVIAAGGGFGR